MRAIRTVLGLLTILSSVCWCQQSNADWRAQVNEDVKAQKWDSAMAVVDEQLAQEPRNLELLESRARLLLWAGRLDDAAVAWKHVLTLAPDDADNWMGLSSVYWRQGHAKEALIAIGKVLQLDPGRADAHIARGRALLSLKDTAGAREEFRRAIELDPGNKEAAATLNSIKQGPRHQLLIGSESDLFSFAGLSQQNEISLSSRWSEHWATAFGGGFYARNGIDASKFQASTSFNLRRWGAFTLGGTVAHDNDIIPKNEVFFGYDHGFRLTSLPVLRGLELAYGQHWYWYRSVRVLGITQTAVLYLPRDWMWSLSVTGAKSEFPSLPAQWSTSESSRLQFPIVPNERHRIEGTVFAGWGREDFSEVDQIGSFSSHTYGGGLRFQFVKGQDIRGFAQYETRSHYQSETGFGATYGIRF